MARKREINIKETTRELKQLLHQQKSGRIKEQVQVLYLITSQQVASALTAATLIGRDYSTVKRWLRLYRKTEIKELFKLKHRGGRSVSLSQAVLEALEKRQVNQSNR